MEAGSDDMRVGAEDGRRQTGQRRPGAGHVVVKERAGCGHRREQPADHERVAPRVARDPFGKREEQEHDGGQRQGDGQVGLSRARAFEGEEPTSTGAGSVPCLAVRVREIWRYPVKSAQGERVRRSAVTAMGVAWDRQLAVVDAATGRPLTARREPKLLMLSATVTSDAVRLETPEKQPLESDEALSEWLGRGVRLAHPPIDRQPEYEFPIDPEDESGPWGVWSGPAGVWHDSTRTRVSILSTASLRAWPVRRFRPNVLVDGAGEDTLVGRRVAIGPVVLDVAKRIDRCVVVTRPQPGGIGRDLDVLRTVLRESDGFLGVGALVVTPGHIQVGDEVTDLGDGR